MRKLALFTMILKLLLIECKAQIPKNNLYSELLGPGFIFSFNYERQFLLREKFHLCGNFGLGVALEKEDAFVPMTLTGNFGQSKHFFEVGVGYTHRPNPDDGVFGHFVVGYKRIVKNGLSFKIRASPLIPLNNRDPDDIPVIPWGGISFGYAF